MSGWVYIPKSIKNSRYYIGSTSDLSRRIEEHNTGKSTYTSFSKPFEIIFSQQYKTLLMARKVERWIKRQKDKKLIDKIISDKIIKKVLW